MSNFSPLARVIRTHPVKAAGFLVTLIALLWFAVSFLADALYFNDPKHHNQAIEEWMTPRYVSRSWRVPPEELATLLGLPPRRAEGRPPTMGQIADELGLTLDQLEARIAQTAQDLKDRRGGGPKND